MLKIEDKSVFNLKPSQAGAIIDSEGNFYHMNDEGTKTFMFRLTTAEGASPSSSGLATTAMLVLALVRAFADDPRLAEQLKAMGLKISTEPE